MKNEKKYTPETVQAYIQGDGTHCPACKSLNITTKEIDLPCVNVTCLDCDEEWREVYQLVGLNGQSIPDEENAALNALKITAPMLNWSWVRDAFIEHGYQAQYHTMQEQNRAAIAKAERK